MSANDKQRNKYVTFKSGNEYFGLKIEYVSEIIVYQEITEIPESEDYIKGLINLRGKIIPVIDVRIRFKQEPMEYTDRTCIIVITVKDIVVGLIVEKIAEVVEITEDNILIACYNCHFGVINKIEYDSKEYWELMNKCLEHRKKSTSK